MRADYESRNDTLQITLADIDQADDSDDTHERAVVVTAAERPVLIDLYYPGMGLDAPLSAIVDRWPALDHGALLAAATAALAVPDRPVTIEVGPPFPEKEEEAEAEADEEVHAA